MVGYARVMDRPTAGRWRPDADDYDTDVLPTVRATVGPIWTFRDHRRTRVASRLVAAVAALNGTTVVELAWEAPFTEAGEALARHLTPDALWLA